MHSFYTFVLNIYYVQVTGPEQGSQGEASQVPSRRTFIPGQKIEQ